MDRVLVVDDSEDQRQALEMVLTDAGFEVVGAADGVAGLRLAQELRPDVILLDMMMPEMDGLEFLSRLAARPSAPPVVANSGFAAFRAEALRRGAHAFLIKPLSIDTLLAALRSALARRPVPPSVVAENEANVERAREAALRETEDVVGRLDERGMSAVREPLERIASWGASYFGHGQCLVTLLRGPNCWVEAARAAPAASTDFQVGQQAPREDFFCDDVIAAGSTLVLTDPAHHPCHHFARHKALDYGTRFYVGVPLTTPSGAVLGTLCLVDGRTHEFHGEDMRVLEALGLAAARGLQTGVWPLDDRGAFGREYLDLFVDVAATRASRDSGACVAVTVEWGHGSGPVPRAPGLAAVRLDAHVVLLWGGPAGAWSPPEGIARHARDIIELGGVRDPEAARARLRTIGTAETFA